MEHTNFQRRSFLKKAVYIAPAVVAIGTLTTPASALTTGSRIWTGTVNGKPSPITVTTTPTAVKINNVVIPKTGSRLSRFASFIK